MQSQRQQRQVAGGAHGLPPKRPLNAYMIWLSEMRGMAKKDCPKVTMVDFAKNAGKIWKSLKDKHFWVEKASVQRAEYMKAKSQYLSKCQTRMARKSSSGSVYVGKVKRAGARTIKTRAKRTKRRR